VMRAVLLGILLCVLFLVNSTARAFAQTAVQTVTPQGVPIGFSSLQLWDLVVGFIVPPLLSIVMQSHWDVRAQACIAFAVSILLGAVTTYLNGSVNIQDWVGSALIIAVTAMNMYNHFWKNTGVTQSIEAHTDFMGRRQPVPLPENPMDTGAVPRRQ